MATVLTCPECDTTLKLATDPGPGKKVKCPKCEAIFTPDDAESRRVSAERPVAPARPRRRPADDDEDERRPRRARKTQGGGGLMVGLLVGGGVLLLLLLTCGGGFALVGYFMYRKAPQPVAKNVQANNPALPPGANNAMQPAGGNNPPAANNPAPQPADPPMPGPAVPPPQANPPMPGPGGNQPGNNQFPVALSNARVSRLGARMNISVEYKYLQAGPKVNVHLVIKSGGGNTYRGDIFGILDEQGTLSFRGITFGGIDRGPYEMYLETGIGRLGPPHQQISNTITAN